MFPAKFTYIEFYRICYIELKLKLELELDYIEVVSFCVFHVNV